MKIILSVLVLLSCQNLLAQWSFQGLLGLQSGAVNVGADLDYQSGANHSIGGYFVLASEEDNVRSQFWSLGADAKVFFGPDLWKVYLAPGVGVASFETNNGTDSEMTFGTLMKAGTLLELSPGLYLGLEYMLYFNWFSDEAPAAFNLMNAALRIDF